MRVLTFEGTPRAIGRAFGESCRDEVRRLYAARVENAIQQAKDYGGRTVSEADVLSVADRSLPFVERHHLAGHQELTGIAEGAGLALRQIWAMNALTDVRDVLAFGDVEGEGCTSFLVCGERAFIGQTWDLATDNMPYVVVVRRRPEGAPATACLTLVGCLSLIGMNEHGLAIGTTNIRTRDSRAGVGYLDVIHGFLAGADLDLGARGIVEAHRAGAHYYFAMDAARAAVAVECTAELAQRTDVTGTFVHTNHILTEAFRSLEANTPVSSSAHRLARMEGLIAGTERITEAELMRFMADHDGGEVGICRHHANGISSNGAIVMEPSERKIWAVHGQACQGEWIEVSVPS